MLPSLSDGVVIKMRCPSSSVILLKCIISIPSEWLIALNIPFPPELCLFVMDVAGISDGILIGYMSLLPGSRQ